MNILCLKRLFKRTPRQPKYSAAQRFPHKIWVLIAQFLPALVVRDLISLNSSLFNIAMDCRYRQICFAYLGNRMLRTLARLK